MGTESNGLNPVEQLVIMQAAYKAIGKEVSPQGCGLRSEVDSHYKDLYEKTGSKSFEVDLLGEEVGTMSIKFTKPKPEETCSEFKVTDYIKLCKRVVAMSDGYDLEIMRKFVESRVGEFAEYYLNETGECLAGTDIVTEVIPAKPKEYAGTTFRPNYDKVTDICRRSSKLPGIARLLLGARDE